MGHLIHEPDGLLGCQGFVGGPQGVVWINLAYRQALSAAISWV